MKRYPFSSRKAGMAPGTLIHVGQLRSEKASVRLVKYGADKVQDCSIRVEDLTKDSKDGKEIIWIHLSGLDDVKAVATVGELFGIHALVLEDVLNTSQRPKLEDCGTYIYIAMKMLTWPTGSSDIVSEHINLIVGQGFVLTFQESQENFFEPIRDRIKSTPERFFHYGAGYLVYTLMDRIVDHYFVVLEQAGEKIEALEGLLIQDPQQNLLPEIHSLKIDLLFLRRSVWPLREVVAGMERNESPLFDKATILYIRDLYDHTVQVIEALEIYRDMTGSMIDIYLSGVSNRMNEVVKMLTAISTIFMPLTFLAGVYGMNFKHMPETEWPYGYPLGLVIMGGIGLFMFRYFKTRGWI